jgi:cytochrome c553
MIKALTLLLALFGASTGAMAQDAAAGQRKAAMCIGCHGIQGYQASFPEVHRVPKISGQNAKYIVAALAAYKSGERKHPSMRGLAGSLSEQDMADLAAFYEKHGEGSIKPVSAPPAAPRPAVAELLTKGACASCHGANYNKAIDPSYPKLAGQHADYLFVALKSYKAKDLSTAGRNNAIMSGQVAQFKPAELKAIANYLGSLQGDMKVVPQSRFR